MNICTRLFKSFNSGFSGQLQTKQEDAEEMQSIIISNQTRFIMLRLTPLYRGAFKQFQFFTPAQPQGNNYNIRYKRLSNTVA